MILHLKSLPSINIFDAGAAHSDVYAFTDVFWFNLERFYLELYIEEYFNYPHCLYWPARQLSHPDEADVFGSQGHANEQKKLAVDVDGAVVLYLLQNHFA